MTLPFRHNDQPIAAGELGYPCPEPPQPGATVELASGVHWVRMPLPFALDHVNVWLLEDGIAKSGAALWTSVDTGVAIDSIRQYWQRLLPSFPLRRQIVTHCHPDHLGLAAWLEHKTGAALSISQGEYTTAHLIWGESGGYGIPAMLALFKTHGLEAAVSEELLLRGNSFRHNIPEIPNHYHRLLDGDELAIGERAWSVIAGFGHSPEHSSLYCKELGILISGDMLLPRISTNISVM